MVPGIQLTFIRLSWHALAEEVMEGGHRIIGWQISSFPFLGSTTSFSGTQPCYHSVNIQGLTLLQPYAIVLSCCEIFFMLFLFFIVLFCHFTSGRSGTCLPDT